MKTEELKAEIQQLLDTVPEDNLQVLVDYLRNAQNPSNKEEEVLRHLRQILKEDKDLLEKLAQ